MGDILNKNDRLTILAKKYCTYIEPSKTYTEVFSMLLNLSDQELADIENAIETAISDLTLRRVGDDV